MVAGLVVTVAVLGALRLTSTPSGSASTDATAVPVGDKVVSASFAGNVVRVVLAAGPSDPGVVVAEASVDTDVVVRQAVCPPESVLSRHIVLFGHIVGEPGTAPDITVSGLKAGTMAKSGDGSFIFVSDDLPDPGTEWIADIAGYAPVRGHVAFFVVLQSDQTGSGARCIVYDPAIESLKP